MAVTTSFQRVELPLADAFTISRGTTEVAENVVVRVSDGQYTGVGAAAPSAHYGETAATVEAVLPELLAVVESVGDPHALAEIERRCRETVRDNPAARCSVSIACHDLVAKRLGVPLYRLLGLDPERAPVTSYTIGIDDPDAMGDRARQAIERGHTVLKTKLGTDDDRARIAAVREAAPDARIRVDANEAWTPRETVDNCAWLAEYDVEFVEQPVPAENPEGLRFATERTSLPIAADESVVTASDVPRVADRCDIANLKLMKCGSIREARRLIATARAHGLETMLGCMVETNAAIAAGCHLAPLVEYVDLDGALLLGADPFDGVPMDGGEIRLSELDRNGTGAVEQPE